MFHLCHPQSFQYFEKQVFVYLLSSSVFTLVYHNPLKVQCPELYIIYHMDLKSQNILRLLLTLVEIHTWMQAKHF